MKLKVGFATDIGRKRTQNQDTVGAFPEQGLFVVADGMGGHRGGETASSMAVALIQEFVGNSRAKSSFNARKALVGAIQAANVLIFDRSHTDSDLQGMGTTATSLLFDQSLLTIGHVGDSRCYYFRPGALWQLTRDHSLVQEKLRAGLITRDQMKTDRMKNVITRSVGFESEVMVEIYEMPIQAGDVFLVCSDGLSGLLEDSKMQEIVQKNFFEKGDLNRTVDVLIETANNNGGDDNITAIMIQVEKLDG